MNLLNRVTRGSQNTLFHLIQFDGLEGVVISPSPQAMVASQGHLQSQVLTNFYKSCLQIHNSFQRTSTQPVSPKRYEKPHIRQYSFINARVGTFDESEIYSENLSKKQIMQIQIHKVTSLCLN